MRYKVIMICREIWRAETVVDIGDSTIDLEGVKDLAWRDFDKNKSKDLEQENFTKVEKINL